MSSRVTTVWKRRVGVVGRNVLIGIFQLQVRSSSTSLSLFTCHFLLFLSVFDHLLAGFELYVSLLPIASEPDHAAAAAKLARKGGSTNRLDFYFEKALHRLF